MDKKELRKLLANLSWICRSDFDSRQDYMKEIDAEIIQPSGLADLDTIMEAAYSPNQLQFIADAKACGLEVDHSYSGRGMYGDCCPAVRVEYMSELTTTANWTHDNMGRGWVMYAQY